MQNRPPIVVILGHVDHGKTSLLDALLKTSVATSETGGITQSTRTFQLMTGNREPITFVDTPGHEAFLQMRSRGADIADIALLVIAGNDGVMPQTKESIATIKTAGIPTIVVVTKADLPEFNVDKIKSQLAENELLVEGYGGDIPLVAVSAKTGDGLSELMEMIHLVSSLQPPTSDPSSPLEAVVLESSLDSKRGPIAVVIVKNGTLVEGQLLYLGQKLVGKTRAITTTSGEKIKGALPSTPAEIMGLTEVLPVGAVVTSEPSSTTLGLRPSPPTAKPRTEGEKLGGERGVVKIILKADVAGSLEAVQASLPAGVVVVSAGTGDILESDVLLAQSTGSDVMGFNTKVSSSVVKLAERDKVKIYTTKIIYELLEKIDLLVHPKETEKIVGKANVVAEFKIDGQHVAGCKCTEGEIKKASQVRLGEKTMRIKSLRLGKTEIESVKAGQEFGAIFSPVVDFKIGDIIIAVEVYG